MNAPIIFIHYGAARYLKWTLRCARAANPDKRIVFLGDETNRRLARGVAEFVDFESLAGAENEQEFQRVFRVIQGDRHRFNKANGVEYWLKFVFWRWFLIEEFLRREKLGAFWTFDSDTLILLPLGPREARFAQVFATTQCKDECLNGWVGSEELVAGYTGSILDQFRNPGFLESQRQRLQIHAGLAFNEMDAFSEFRRRTRLKTWHAQKPIGGEIFDDALAFTDGFAVAAEKILGRTLIKRLWTNGSSIFARTGDGDYVRMVTCNMSWMPDYLWGTILHSRQTFEPADTGTPIDPADLREIDLREPLLDRFLRKTSVSFWRLRRGLADRFSRV